MRDIICWAFLIFVSLLTTPLSAQIQMEITADTNRMMVGDQQKLIFTITCDPSITIGKIELDSITSMPGFELSEEKEWAEKATQMSRIMTKEITFMAFEPGEFTFPAVPYQYNYQGKDKIGFSRTWKLTVLPLNTSEPDIAPNKDIIEESFFFEKYKTTIFITAALILLAGLAYYLNKKFRRSIPEIELAEVTDPDVEALQALKSLRESGLWQNEDHKVFQTALSGILRLYLTRSLNIPALNSTSGEIVRYMKQLNMPDSMTETTDKALNIADLVKFANAQSRNEINFTFIGKVEKLVEEGAMLKSEKSKI